MNPVVHFEMPYEDKERVARFYQQAFGWRMQQTGADMGHYVLAETTETANGRPTTPGEINGGFFEKKPDWPAQHPSVVIGVDDIRGAMARVDGTTFVSSVLPWRSSGGAHPWHGTNHAERTRQTTSALSRNVPAGGLVWGGDWARLKDMPHYELDPWRRFALEARPVDG